MKHLLFVALAVLFTLTAFSQTIPQYTGYVNDFANLLSPQTEALLTQKIAAYEKQSSIEIAIVTMNDLQGYHIDDYCIKLAETWGVGKKQTDNGLVLFVSTDINSRGFRIEVGYGLEGRMTDYSAGNITRPTVQNYFKHSKFDEGMVYALDEVLKVLGPETKEQYEAYLAKKAQEEAAQWEEIKEYTIYTTIFLAFTALVVFLLYRWYRYYRRQKELEEERKRLEQDVLNQQRNVLTVLHEYTKTLEPLVAAKFHNAQTVTADIGYNVGRVLAYKVVGERADHLRLISTDIAETLKSVEQKVKKVVSNHKIYREVRNDSKRFNLAEETTEKLIARNIKVAQQIDAENPKSVWTQTDPKVPAKVAFESAREYAKKCEEIYVKALMCLQKNDFDGADNAHKGAHVYLEKAIAAANYPTALRKEIADRRRDTMSMLSKIDSMMEKAVKSVEREHVNATTKKLVDQIAAKKKAADKAMSTDSTLDWFVAFLVVLALYQFLQRIHERSNQDIQDYHDAIQRKKDAEEAARRRKREEEEEEERRARRRREDSYSSSSSYGGSSYGGSSGGSSFGGFGGGSFGGGGSTSSW